MKISRLYEIVYILTSYKNYKKTLTICMYNIYCSVHISTLEYKSVSGTSSSPTSGTGGARIKQENQKTNGAVASRDRFSGPVSTELFFFFYYLFVPHKLAPLPVQPSFAPYIRFPTSSVRLD